MASRRDLVKQKFAREMFVFREVHMAGEGFVEGMSFAHWVKFHRKVWQEI